jgi:hypothetical protein
MSLRALSWLICRDHIKYAARMVADRDLPMALAKISADPRPLVVRRRWQYIPMDEYGPAVLQRPRDEFVRLRKVLNKILILDVICLYHQMFESFKELLIQRKPQHADHMGDRCFSEGRLRAQGEHAVIQAGQLTIQRLHGERGGICTRRYKVSLPVLGSGSWRPSGSWRSSRSIDGLLLLRRGRGEAQVAQLIGSSEEGSRQEPIRTRRNSANGMDGCTQRRASRRARLSGIARG